MSTSFNGCLKRSTRPFAALVAHCSAGSMAPSSLASRTEAHCETGVAKSLADWRVVRRAVAGGTTGRATADGDGGEAPSTDAGRTEKRSCSRSPAAASQSARCRPSTWCVTARRLAPVDGGWGEASQGRGRALWRACHPAILVEQGLEREGEWLLQSRGRGGIPLRRHWVEALRSPVL